jgi:hypothetical protein
MSLSRRFRRGVKKNRQLTAKNPRKVLLEAIEPHLLLSADLSYTMIGATNNLSLKFQNIDSNNTLQLINP